MRIAPNPSTPQARKPEVLSDELKRLAGFLAGTDAWHTRGWPEQGIPPMLVADCGHGVTVCGARSSPATCFPTGVGLASTWNPVLMEEVGRTIGRECLALGVSILLGPKINLHRLPLNGRNFETFSEDPLLAGLLGAGIIRGIQSEGVGACVKALAANNQQKDQLTTSVQVDERALRELYLRAFEIAIEESSPSAAMTSYNPLNGENTAESAWLIRQVLRTDWGFEGLVVSDWRAVQTEAVYGSGLDLEMPGPGKFLNPENVIRALHEGLMTGEDVRERAERILRVARSYAKDENGRESYASLLDSPENRAAALRAAEESIVLLKNEGPILPLETASTRRLAVIGPNAASARLGGGGSASVTPFEAVSPLEGLRRLCGDRVEVVHEEGCGLVGKFTVIPEVFTHGEIPGNGLKAEFFNGPDCSGQPDASWVVPGVDFSWGWAAPGPGVTRYEFSVCFSGRLRARSTGLHRIGVHAQEGVVRLWLRGRQVVDEWPSDTDPNFEGNYENRHRVVEIELAAGEEIDIRLEYGKRAARAAVRLEWCEPGAADSMAAAERVAGSADAVVLCLGLSNLFEGGNADRASIDLPPVQVELLRRVVAANPRTIVVLNNGGPLAMPWEPLVPAIFEAWYPGQAGGTALARLIFGLSNPSGRLPDTLAVRLEDHAAVVNYPGDGKIVHYREGMFIGYRHFDKAGIEPHYPFGFGLSYTTFRISPPLLEQTEWRCGEALRFQVEVENTGSREGSETVQIYLANPDSDADTPLQQLIAFQKVRLAAGELRVVSFEIPARHFGEWSVDGRRPTPGRRSLRAGASSRNFQTIDITLRQP